ncbi:MAG TPA: hypothetical protein VHN74_10375 [Candidatus Angelobacter sp.]|jgi:hypothetical protein|nr:hypothetical protein [Candidatus Angelobacter sp.]
MSSRSFLLFATFLPITVSLQAQTTKACLAHHPIYIAGTIEPRYTQGCTGHDEPELFPVSSAPGSARDLTWTVVLPTGGRSNVSDVGPTFWFGGTVTDPKSLFGQAFVELQFYPDSTVTKCFNDGGFSVNFTPNVFTACSPVFALQPTHPDAKNFTEPTAFNAMLEDSATPGSPLIMHAGDTVTVHYFVTPAADGFHITVTDLATGHSGTIVLNSQSDGPLMPAYDTQQVGNSLGWGNVNDAPNSFVWEIGHASIFTGGDAFCVPGQTFCDSYNAASWLGFSPIQIKSVTFGDGSSAKSFGAVSDQGGKAEVAQTCATYGGAFCIYPWYTLGKSGFHYGVDYSDTLKDFGQADQFTQTQQCGGPFGPNTTFCSTILK